MKRSNYELGKAGLIYVASWGVGSIIGNIVGATTPANTGKLQQISILAGVFAIAMYVGDRMQPWMDTRFDSAFEGVLEIEENY